MAGHNLSLHVPRVQLLFAAINRMLDHVIASALSSTSDQQRAEYQQSLEQWKQRVMVGRLPALHC